MQVTIHSAPTHVDCRCWTQANPIRLQADANLGKFLDYCTYGHMIDNVILIVTGTLHERDVQVGFIFCVTKNIYRSSHEGYREALLLAQACTSERTRCKPVAVCRGGR